MVSYWFQSFFPFALMMHEQGIHYQLFISGHFRGIFTTKSLQQHSEAAPFCNDEILDERRPNLSVMIKNELLFF